MGEPSWAPVRGEDSMMTPANAISGCRLPPRITPHAVGATKRGISTTDHCALLGSRYKSSTVKNSLHVAQILQGEGGALTPQQPVSLRKRRLDGWMNGQAGVKQVGGTIRSDDQTKKRALRELDQEVDEEEDG